MNRMQFLRGRKDAIRPPWSEIEPRFIDLCTRCGDCISACEEHIIVTDRGGFPQLDFNRGECTFCRDCVDACKHDALAQHSDQAWILKADINGDCLAMNAVVCRSCGDCCDQRAVKFQLITGGRALPAISHSLCNGCGACFSVCPTKAIQMKEAA